MAAKNPDYSSIVFKLLEKTKAGKVEWKEWGSGFRADLQEGFVFDIEKVISRGDTGYNLAMSDSQSREIFALYLADDPDTMITQSQLYEALSDLYDIARRHALRIDEKVERVSEILERI